MVGMLTSQYDFHFSTIIITALSEVMVQIPSHLMTYGDVGTGLDITERISVAIWMVLTVLALFWTENARVLTLPLAFDVGV